MYAIGSVADFPKFRKMLFENGVFVTHIHALERTEGTEIIENGAWAISNFCKDKSREDSHEAEMATSALCEVVKKNNRKTQISS